MSYVLISIPNNLAIQGTGAGFDHKPQPGDKLCLSARTFEVWQELQLQGFQTLDGQRAYRLVFSESSDVVDIPAFSQQPNTPLQIWSPNGGKNQLWTVLPQGGITHDGQTTFVQVKVLSAFNGFVMNYPHEIEGGNVTQVPESSGDQSLGQYWTLQSSSDARYLVAVTTRTEVDSKLTLSSDPTSRGWWGPNQNYRIWFMNVPGVVQTQAWQDATGSGRLGGPGAEIISSDVNGNLIPKQFDLPWLAGPGTKLPGGSVLVVLEDKNGYVAAMTTIDPSLFVQRTT